MLTNIFTVLMLAAISLVSSGGAFTAQYQDPDKVKLGKHLTQGGYICLILIIVCIIGVVAFLWSMQQNLTQRSGKVVSIPTQPLLQSVSQLTEANLRSSTASLLPFRFSSSEPSILAWACLVKIVKHSWTRLGVHSTAQSLL
jgi:hypothetical protein